MLVVDEEEDYFAPQQASVVHTPDGKIKIKIILKPQIVIGKSTEATTGGLAQELGELEKALAGDRNSVLEDFADPQKNMTLTELLNRVCPQLDLDCTQFLNQIKGCEDYATAEFGTKAIQKMIPQGSNWKEIITDFFAQFACDAQPDGNMALVNPAPL